MEEQIPFRTYPEEIDGDMICAICGEPWDRHGVLCALRGKGDMSRVEAELFINGWGCPCCLDMIPHRIAEIENSLELLEKFISGLEYLGYISLFRAEYNSINKLVDQLEEILEKIIERLEEEEKRIMLQKT